MLTIRDITLSGFSFITASMLFSTVITAMESEEFLSTPMLNSTHISIMHLKDQESFYKGVLRQYISETREFKGLDTEERLFEMCTRYALKASENITSLEDIYKASDFSSVSLCHLRAIYACLSGKRLFGNPSLKGMLYLISENIKINQTIGCGIEDRPKTGFTRLIQLIKCEDGKKSQGNADSEAKYIRGAMETLLNAQMCKELGMSFESLKFVKTLFGSSTPVPDFYTSYEKSMECLEQKGCKIGILLLSTATDFSAGKKGFYPCVLKDVLTYYPLGQPLEGESFVCFEMYSAHGNEAGKKDCESQRKRLEKPETFKDVVRMIAAAHEQYPKEGIDGISSEKQKKYKGEARQMGIGVTPLLGLLGSDYTARLEYEKIIPLNTLHVYAVTPEMFEKQKKRYENYIVRSYEECSQ